MRILFAASALALALAPAALAQGQQQPPRCDAPEHRALDFWIGEWDAHRADTNAPSGRSSIRSEDAGCVITERWTSLNAPYSGRSLNIYDRVSGRWEQYWVDSTGARTHFIGGPIDGGMQLTTIERVPILSGAMEYSRVTLTARDDGTVFQHGESSADGQTWTTRYALVYRRRAE